MAKYKDDDDDDDAHGLSSDRMLKFIGNRIFKCPSYSIYSIFLKCP